MRYNAGQYNNNNNSNKKNNTTQQQQQSKITSIHVSYKLCKKKSAGHL